MVLKPGSFGNVGKGLNLACVTSGGLGGAIGSAPMCDWLSGAASGEWYDSRGSGDDCCVSAESAVSSTGSARREGGQGPVVRLSAVMAVGVYHLRSSLCCTG